VALGDLPLEIEGRDGLVLAETEIVLEAQGRPPAEELGVEADVGRNVDPAELGLEAELVEERLELALRSGRRCRRQDQDSEDRNRKKHAIYRLGRHHSPP